MKIIKPSFEIIDQQAGIDGLLKHLESAGGTCCKSEDGNTACSPKEFAELMIKSGRVDLLEHGTVYLATRDHLNRWRSAEYKTNHSSRVVEENPNLPIEEQTLYIIQVSEVKNSAIKSPKLGLAPVLIAGLR